MNQEKSGSGQIELDQEQLIFRQIDRFHRVFSSLKEEKFKKNKPGQGTKIITRANHETVAMKAWFAAKSLKATVSSLLTDEEVEELESIIEESSERSYSKDSGEIIEDSQRLFEETLKALSRKNMIFEEPENLILEDHTEEGVRNESGNF